MAQMLIGGEWVGARSGNSIEVLNPATGEPVDTAPRGTAEDAREAIDAAQHAFGIWSEWTQAARADVLRRVVALVHLHEPSDLAEQADAGFRSAWGIAHGDLEHLGPR